MKVIVVNDYDEMSRKAAEIVAEVVDTNAQPVLGLATGSTPIGMYKLLADFCSERRLSFAKARTVNLDEYVGLDGQSDQSYVYFMAKNFFDNVDIDKQNTNLPNGKAANLQEECDRYTRLVESMPQDVQVLGLGSNGHIGFNEPDTAFDSHTHVVRLAESTIRDNSRLFADESLVPRQAITMGIADIMQAKKILMLASGANKAKAVAAMVEGEVTPTVPASVLQNHPDCTVIVDKQAASLLKRHV